MTDVEQLTAWLSVRMTYGPTWHNIYFFLQKTTEDVQRQRRRLRVAGCCVWAK